MKEEEHFGVIFELISDGVSEENPETKTYDQYLLSQCHEELPKSGKYCVQRTIFTDYL